MDALSYKYRLVNSFILQTDRSKDLGVDTDRKFHFLHYVDFFLHMQLNY
jgi:hypothetical protein